MRQPLPLSATPSHDLKALLSWPDITESVWTKTPTVSYVLYRDGTKVTGYDGSSLAYTDTGLTNEQEYVYLVALLLDGAEVRRSKAVSVVAEDRLHFGQETISDQTYTENINIGTVTLPAAISGDAALTYALTPDLPAGLIFDAAARTITGMSTEPQDATEYTYKVSDANDNTAELTFTIAIANNPPSFGSDSVDNQAYTESTDIGTVNLPAATGGDGTLTYALTSDLPAGLSFDAAARTISGTPTEPQAETGYTYKATDGDGETAELTFTIAIANNPPSFGEETVAAQSYTESTDIGTVTLPAATGGDGALTYALTSELPAGLSFDAAARTISGTPTEPQAETEYTYKVTDGDGETAGLTFTIAIANNPPSFGEETVAAQSYAESTDIGTVNLPAATGGDGALTYTLMPEPPAGLSFDAAARTITGTPAEPQAETEYTYKVTDGDGETAELTFTIAIANNPPSFGEEAVGDQSYTESTGIGTVNLPAASGGDGALTYTLMPDLPAGLSFDAAARTISGTPTEPQAETGYTYKATDGDGETAELTFTIAIANNPPAFGEETVGDQTYTETVAIGTVTLPAASGGDGALTYTLMPDLPAGLSFDAAARTISGTPTEPQDATEYTYKVTDGDGETAGLTFTIEVSVYVARIDSDGDGLIEISTLEQLDAVRHDLNGDGLADNVNAVRHDLDGGGAADGAENGDAYAAAFPHTESGPVCIAGVTCAGYELDADLDFAGTPFASGEGWEPIGTGSAPYNAAFEGNGHTIANLRINRGVAHYQGLFGRVGPQGRVSNLGLTGAEVVSGGSWVSVLAGDNNGAISNVFAGGSITGSGRGVSVAGGLAGNNTGSISRSYSTVSIGGGGNSVGSLAGSNSGTISDSYAAGTVTSAGFRAGGLVGRNTGDGVIRNSLATGEVSYDGGTPSWGSELGGLAGRAQGTIEDSYYDASVQQLAVLLDHRFGLETKALLAPVDASGIYANWNAVVWDFGTREEYPALKVDFDGDETASVAEFGPHQANRGTVATEETAVPAFVSDVTNRVWKVGKNTVLRLPVATGGDGELTYSLSGDLQAGMTFDPEPGNYPGADGPTISGTPTAPQAATKYTYTVTDTDYDTDSLTFTIEVQGQLTVNGEMPPDQYYTQGQPIETLTLPAGSGGVGTLTYTLEPALPKTYTPEPEPGLPEGLVFDPVARTISGTPTEWIPETVYIYTIYTVVEGDDGEDVVGNAILLPFRITVKERLSFDGAAPVAADWTQNSSVELELPEASGGKEPLTYSLEPELPAALSFDAATRTISGVPTGFGPAVEYTYGVVDADGDTAELVFSTAVAEDLAPDFGTATVQDQEYQAHEAITQLSLPVATGGNGQLAYSIEPELPPGLTFDSAARTISGTPEFTSPRTQYVYAATDSDGDRAPLSFHIEVVDNTVNFGEATIADQYYTMGVDPGVLTLPAANGGNAPLTYSLTPELPAGLSFDAAARTISGTPSEPHTETEYTYTATDADNDGASLTFTITVVQAQKAGVAVPPLTVSIDAMEGDDNIVNIVENADGGGVTFEGTATPGVDVQLRLHSDDSDTLAETDADADGAWSATAPTDSFAEGDASVTATATRGDERGGRGLRLQRGPDRAGPRVPGPFAQLVRQYGRQQPLRSGVRE